MSIEITWSTTNGGSAIAGNVEHGSAPAGDTLSEQTIYIRHNGDSPITDCAIYLAPKSDTYSGGDTPEDDLAELLSWGDADLSSDFGGVQINMDAAGGFPIGAWGTASDKDPTGGFTFRTGQGDSAENAIPLLTAMGLPGDGVIQAGDDPDVKFQLRVKIPFSEGNTGIRQFDIKLKYTFTT